MRTMNFSDQKQQNPPEEEVRALPHSDNNPEVSLEVETLTREETLAPSLQSPDPVAETGTLAMASAITQCRTYPTGRSVVKNNLSQGQGIRLQASAAVKAPNGPP